MNVTSHLPKVLPVVLGYSRFASTTALCLDTLLPQAQACGQTVLAVDNGSPDDSAALLQHYVAASPYRDSLALRLHRENLGFGGGMNAAIQFWFSQSPEPLPEWILLINSDTLFPANALKAWLAALSAAPGDIGLVGPLTNNAGNAQKMVIGHLHNADSIQQDFAKWSQLAAALMSQPTELLWETQRADFFCVAIRTHVWQALKGLDPAYGRGYYEDFDFSVRVSAIGYRCVLTEDCLIYHQGSASFKNSPEQKLLIRRNKALLLSRFPKLALPHVRQDNLDLLQKQLAWIHEQKHHPKASPEILSALRMRMLLRWEAALGNLPRSPVKRWLWHRRLSSTHKLFRD